MYRNSKLGVVESVRAEIGMWDCGEMNLILLSAIFVICKESIYLELFPDKSSIAFKTKVSQEIHLGYASASFFTLEV
ncbi:predicted protein [Sclerotinia sclerotiorum 1980 UF-70]|uniref:Uncharacterized protein n=1 Tax=Sclerotinia sclerotiorum (strain ATCC 18683 / 1980 / Ss-1) TaxID=665079 RepID=A7F0Z8_SCLS1|nr:predicted protein [Sclerotinia sclerotiorum 1980 UF-70]EDN95390.1 predicted protein [Sclerotinia sclerotiorum 1980 UF-70]